MERHTYRHIVQYYETDKMGIAHHSNYIRWMEEARVDLLTKIGWDYDKLESLGVFSPVTAVECRFRHSCTFADAVDIAISVESFSGVRLRLRYVMTAADGTLLCESVSEHVFLDSAGKPIRMHKSCPELFGILKHMQEEEIIEDGTV